jgi:ABC-2 type transport system permease protein
MHFFRMYWRRSLRKPGAILLWLAVPFVFMGIYQLVFGGSGSSPRATIAIVDQDSSMVSSLVRGAFGQGPVADLVRIIEVTDLDAVDARFADESASAALIIPPGFGERLLRMQPDTLQLLNNPRHTIGPQIAEAVTEALLTIGNGLLTRFAGPLADVRAQFDSDTSPNPDEVGAVAQRFYLATRSGTGLGAIDKIDITLIDEEGENADDFNMAALFFPGLVMFGLLTVSLRLEHAFLIDRRNGVTERFITAPVSPWRVAFEQRLYTASFAYGVGMLAGILGGLIWHIPANGLGTVNLVVVSLALFISGINGCIFSLSNSPRAVSAISSLVMIFLTILGGGFFPAEFMPPAFQSFAQWIPTGAANIALTRTLTGREVPISIPLFVATSIAFFAVGMLVGRRRLR